MTSPVTNPGTVVSGAVYRCTACGVELSIVRDDVTVALARSCDCPHDTAISREQRLPRAVVLDIARDDRAGVTLPTAIQPVGGDQLEPSRVGQVEGESNAGGGHKNSMGTARAAVTANADVDGSHAFAREAACHR